MEKIRRIGRISAFELLITTFVLCFAFLSLIAVLGVYAAEQNGTQVNGTRAEWTQTNATGTTATAITDCGSTNLGCCATGEIRCPVSVGGEVVSVNKFDLIAPYVGLALTIIAPATIFITIKHRKTKQ